MKVALRSICIGILFTLANCQCGVQSVVVNQILIDRMPSAEGMPVDRDAMRATTIKVLQSTDSIKLKLNDEGKGILRVRLREAPGSNQVAVDLKYRGMSGNDIQSSFGSGSASQFEGALKLAVDDWLGAARGQSQSVRSQIAVVERHLAGEFVPEPVLLQAIHVLGNSKSPPVSGLLIRELKNERVALAALSALTRLANPTSIDAITEFAERKPADVRRQAILAARQIGGSHAAAWLFTLSTGHEDPEVRQTASQALQDVERRLNP